MPAKLIKNIPTNGLFVVKNSKTGEFYARSFKMKQSAKERRDELNLESAIDGADGRKIPGTDWHVTKGVDHIHYAG